MSERSALIDPITGLSSRWYFDLILEFAFPLGRRDIPISLVLCELQGIGPYVEHLGVSRDEALASVGRKLRQATRGVDVIARFGEDRVVCLLVGCNPWGAVVFVHRMRDVLHVPGEDSPLLLSGGIAEGTDDMSSPDELVNAAERALADALKKDDSGVWVARG